MCRKSCAVLGDSPYILGSNCVPKLGYLCRMDSKEIFKPRGGLWSAQRLVVKGTHRFDQGVVQNYTSQMQTSEGQNRSFLGILVCFFFSGAAGLIYQVAWGKALGLV